MDETGLRRLLDGLTAVRDGDFRTRIPEDCDGLLGEIATVFNGMLDQLSRFTSEVTRVAREVGSEGRLGGQARVPDVSGSWKDLTESVNAMAGNLTTQVRNIAQVATAVACGDLSQKITVDARGEILELKETINTMVDQLSAFADEVTRVAREVGTEGNLGGQATVRGVSGTWKDLTDNVNVMASNLTGQVRSISQVATAVARGDLSQRIVVEAKGEVAALAGVINTMVDTLSAFADEVTRVASEVGTDGILGGQARVPHVAGTWKDLTDSVNSMANNLTGQVRNIAQVTTAVAGGDLHRKIDVDARGEILELKTTINTMVDQLSSFAAEVTRVAREVGSEGRLGGQAEVEGVSGTWKRLTENVNELAGNLTRQVRAIAEVTSAVAEGDLTRSITVDASGEVAELKDNINAMVKSLRQTTRANQEQDWLKTNLARISGLVQGRRDLADVAGLIMDELVPLVSAQYGAFFLAEDTHDGVRLCLIDSYGRPEGSRRPTRFRLGESLVGQAARSRRTIAVDDVPADYVISSGLGDAAPASLVVLPVMAEEQVLGVIELATTGRFTPVHRDFLDQLMETVGGNVNAIIAGARTDELLGESQRLAGELQARSEELQVRQEELQHSNAELEEKAALLASQNRDIETKNQEIEQARQELEARARELARASRYKSEFLANMSHELRTPLNSLLILAQLLSQNPGRNLTPKQVEYAEVIHSAGSDLLQLINDILDLSKVEAGKMDISPERFRLRRLLDSLDAAFRPLTSQKGLEFQVVTAPGVPSELVTDESRLRQVLRNLLSNAVKFTEAGHVELRIERVDTSAADLPDSVRRSSRPALAFRVGDTGIGISEQHLESVFGAFQQADGTTSRTYGGTGLGLSICREIAYLLGGSVHARSTQGEGSCFTLYLPTVHPTVQDTAAPHPPGTATAAPAAEVPGAAPPHSVPPAVRRVLVVEARPRGLLSLLAQSAVADLPGVPSPVQVDTATDPGEAAAALAGRTHHCAVVDCGLPREGARELLGLLDADPALRHVPVLVHCGHPEPSAEEEHRLRARAGAQPFEVLTSLDELRTRIVLHLTAERPGEALPLVHAPRTRPAPAPREADPLAGRTVLIVDDDDRNVFAVTGILELHDMRVVHAENGREGVEALADEDIDLVLMDVMMPQMDGYAATAAMRAMPGRRHVPIIAVTAKAMSGDREKCLAAGADDYVSKPVDAQQLVHCMRRWIDL
ncbi:HAMP domain-containing protein [Streptomyces sp. NPDC021225]|uniref:HAMP domain-containing protein n=1 Tax=Streptomyces sp. NPDC021225 TaxID=3365121 RepID=UPI0037A43349